MFKQIAFSPDGKRLAAISERSDLGEVIFWDAMSSREIHRLRAPTRRGLRLAFSPDGKCLAISGADYDTSTITIYDTATSQRLHNITSGEGARTVKGHWVFTDVAYSPDSKYLASGNGTDRTAKIWSAAGGEILTLKGHTGSVVRIAYSPDGKRLAVVSNQFEVKDGKIAKEQGEIKVWDLATRKEILAFDGCAGLIQGVAYSPNGQYLVAVGGKTTFNPQGASVGGLGELKAWDAHSGQEVLTLRAHDRPITSVVFSPDGRLLATGSEDRNVLLWDASKLLGDALASPIASPPGPIKPEKPDVRRAGASVEEEPERQKRDAETAAQKKTQLQTQVAARQLSFAKILQTDGKMDIARERYKKILRDYPGTPVAEEAARLLKELPASQLSFAKALQKDGKLNKAKEQYEAIVKDYPGSKVAEEASRLLKEIYR